MQLDFTPEQEELRGAVRSVLTKECSMAVVRDLAEKGTEPTALWQTVIGLDWPGLTVPEAHGGIGYGFVELAVVAEELGYAVAPGPLLPTMSQLVPAVLHAGSDAQRSEVLGAVARGERTGTLAVAEHGGGWLAGASSPLTLAEPDGDGWRITGTKEWVVEAGAVDELVVTASTPDGVALFLVPARADGVSVSTLTSFDPSRRVARVHLDTVVDDSRVLGQPGTPAVEEALERTVEEAALALALEMVGTSQRIFDVTLAYAKEREQFGVPIGSFQAIKHKMADVMVAVERARATAYFAAVAVAEGDPRRSLAVSMAKAAAGDAQRLVAKEGIQVHGGIGYMWENDLQLMVKRVKAGELLLGTSAEHRSRVADLIGV